MTEETQALVHHLTLWQPAAARLGMGTVCEDAAAALTALSRDLETARQERDAALARVDTLQRLSACAYQMAGCADAPERFLDALDSAQWGLPLLADEVDALLPVSPDEFAAVRAARAEGLEQAATIAAQRFAFVLANELRAKASAAREGQ